MQSSKLLESPRVYNFVHYDSANQVVSPSLPVILRIPSKIRCLIWSLCDQLDKQSLRLVSRAFRADIDSKLGLAINLDERDFLLKDVSTTFPSTASSLKVWGAKFTHDYVKRILLNPEILTSITFGGPIDLDNFTKILARCLNLSSISVSDRSGFVGKLALPFNMRNVTRLHLGCEGNLKDYLHPYSYLSTLRTFKEILMKVRFPSLKSLTVECINELTASSTVENEDVTLNTFVTLLFQTICSQKSLTELVVRVHNSKQQAGMNPSPYHSETKEQHIRLAHTEQMRNLRLKTLVADTDEELFLLWDAILPHQNTLVTFECLNQTKAWNYFVPIVQANSKTLRIVKLKNLHCGTSKATRIDLTAFESCKNLQELFLSSFSNSTHEVCLRLTTNQKSTPFLDRISKDLPELVRFKALPKSLKKLHVQGFTVKERDLMKIPVGSKNLRVLELQLLGFRGSWPVSTDMGNQLGKKKDQMGDGIEGISQLLPKDTSRYGSGVTPPVLRNLLVKLRKLDTLFVEEFLNDRTDLTADPELLAAIQCVNLIPGDGILKQLGYFGILLDAEEPSCSDHGIRRCQRVDSWSARFNQYRFQQWIKEKLEEDSGHKA